MRYLCIRRNYEPIITIREYVAVMNPETYRRLKAIMTKKVIKDITNEILAAADVTDRDKYYETVMKERPRPGRGGLLPGEGEEDLWIRKSSHK